MRQINGCKVIKYPQLVHRLVSVRVEESHYSLYKNHLINTSCVLLSTSKPYLRDASVTTLPNRPYVVPSFFAIRAASTAAPSIPSASLVLTADSDGSNTSCTPRIGSVVSGLVRFKYYPHGCGV